MKISDFRYVLFDYDDTLVLSGAIHDAAFKSVLESVCSDISFDYDSFRGKGSVEVFEKLGFTSSEARILAKSKSELYSEIAMKELRCAPCVRDVVEFFLNNGKRLGIVSNGTGRNILLGLRLIGLEDCFEIVVSRDHVAEGKPSPEGILMALSHFESLGGDALFIDDSVDGIQASNLVGVRSIKIGSYEKSAHNNFAGMCELLLGFRDGL